MATNDPNSVAEGAVPADAPPSASKPLVVLLAAAGIAAGGWFGGPMLAPMIAGAAAPAPEGEVDDGHGGGGGGHGAPAPRTNEPLVIGDLVLNPARSGGTRFLVASVSLDGTPAALTALRARDAEVRDLLLTILSSKTVDDLAEIDNRDRLREDLRLALNALLGYEGVLRIFFPQFVIQ